jgi:pimeloyl-ACP methyl ester carboxylesterase
LLDIVGLAFGVARRLAGAVVRAVSAPPLAEPVVVGGMPEGVPPAALRREPRLPAPAGWPFGEDFPRTCGTGRFAGGALFWTDFIYDDHGAFSHFVSLPTGGLAPPFGTYVYPDGPAARNGADIFRAAIGLTETDTWWRIDWNTLLDPSVPIALFAFDTGRDGAAAAKWPAGVGIRSGGIDTALLVSGAGAWLIDLAIDARTPVEHMVDMESRSFMARIPRSVLEPTGSWTVRLAAGLANAAGDGFADVPKDHGRGKGQPNAYNVAFRTHEQEAAPLSLWSDLAQAAALTDGDVSQFALAVPWERLAAREITAERIVLGPSIRWYVSSVDLGQGITKTNILSTKPQFLGRVQPYAVCLPTTYAPGQKLPLTLLLHSLALGHEQFVAIDPKLVHQICDARGSVVVTPLARGPACWYFDEGELDVWEVWARVAEQLGADPNRTVIAGYSMGGYAAYKLGLAYPEVFAQAVVLAGPPTCGIRLTPDLGIPGNLDPRSHCGAEGETWPVLVNARWLPFVIAHGVFDGLVPFLSVVEQVAELDRLGYRYTFATYAGEDHIVFALQDKFSYPISQMRTDERQADPGHISFAWYPQLVRADLGIGPHRAWWLSDLAAASDVAEKRGGIAEVDALSYARPDPTRKTRRRGTFLPHWDPTPGYVAEQSWETGQPSDPQPYLTLTLAGVKGLTLDVARAGIGSFPASTIAVATDTDARISLAALPPGMTVHLDGTPTGATVEVPAGRHRITLGSRTDER